LAFATQACFIWCVYVCVFCIKDAPQVVPLRSIVWTTLSVAWIVWRRRQTNGIWEWNVGRSILV